MINAKEAHGEKMMVALSSVGAAIGLTSLKLIIGLLTGSLGIMAEAAHSGLAMRKWKISLPFLKLLF